ncbi:MAG: hypothetical protein R6W76_19500 [Caldilinea sp.]
MSSERVASARDEVRAGLRSVGSSAAPLDSAIDQALREGLAYLMTQVPARTVRFAVTEEALTDGTLLNVRMLVPELCQLIALWSTAHSMDALDYLPLNDGANVLFHVTQAPKVGDELNATYRPLLTVAGFDGATETTLSGAWHDAWIKAAIYCFAAGEVMRARPMSAAGKSSGQMDAYRLLQLAERMAKTQLDGAVQAFYVPVRPVSWNRGV